MRTRKRYRSISKKRFKINFTDLIISLVIVLMIILGIYFTKLGLDFEKNIKPAFTYTAEKSSDYEVLLKPNDYYTTDTLPSGRYYASKSVKEYRLDFKYHLYGDREGNNEYVYNVTAELSGVVDGNNDNGKEVWNRTFNILEDKKESAKNEFSINEKVNIDYEYYNNLARSFEKEYGIAINSVLKVRLNVSYNIDLAETDIDVQNIQDYIELDIPITNTVTEAEENYERITTKNINPKIEDMMWKRTIYYMISIVFILGAIVISVVGIKRNKKNVTIEDMYEKNMNKILKYYRDLIVTVDNEPDITNLEALNVTAIDDLIDVAEQNKTNIICYEVIKSRRSKLYVIVNNYAYIYEITASKIQ